MNGQDIGEHDSDGTQILDALLSNDHPKKLSVAKWATSELDDPKLAERDHECTFWSEGWEKIGERGLLGSLISTDYGGSGNSLISTLLDLEGLGLGLSLIHI